MKSTIVLLLAALFAATGVSTARAATVIPAPYDTGLAWGDGGVQGTVLFNNGDTGGVSSNPPTPTSFSITQSFNVISIATYHWNGGAGATPGTLALKDANGSILGPWDASSAIQGFDVYWYVRPDITIGPGVYTVIDSEPSTWSWTSASFDMGFARILTGSSSVTVRQPDGRIRLGTGAYVGNDVYNTTGTGQSKTGSALKGKTITFVISVQNDGTAADRFKLGATGSVVSAYTVKYYAGNSDITAKVVAGTYKTASLAAGTAVLITAKVTVKSSATADSRVSRLVTITSVHSSAKVDAVKFITKRS